jgi:hypothetical protein
MIASAKRLAISVRRSFGASEGGLVFVSIQSPDSLMRQRPREEINQGWLVGWLA